MKRRFLPVGSILAALLYLGCGDDEPKPRGGAGGDGGAVGAAGSGGMTGEGGAGGTPGEGGAGGTPGAGGAGGTPGAAGSGGMTGEGGAGGTPGAGGSGGTPGAGGSGGSGGIPEPRAILDLQTGGDHVCAALSDGTVRCWGRNDAGQLGLGDTADRGDEPGEMGDALPAVDLGGPAVQVAVGSEHSCALLEGGAVKCWGKNDLGQLGLGDTGARGDEPVEMGDNLSPVDLGAGRSAKALVAGTYHTCALLDDGAVKCWGRNTSGQLGLGDRLARGDGPGEMGDALPTVDLGTGRAAKALTAGGSHTCALLDDDAVKCWGANDWGNLGLGDTQHRGDGPGEMGDALPAVDLGTGRMARAIEAGDAHTCALLDDASLKCWGLNGSNQLGLGSHGNRGDGPDEMGDELPPVDLGGRTPVEVSTGGNHSCVRLDDDSVRCWGYNINGQLGLGFSSARGGAPDHMGEGLEAAELGAGSAPVAIRAGGRVSCAIFDDGAAKCWGRNQVGQLGLGDTEDRGDDPDEMGDALPTLDLGAGD